MAVGTQRILDVLRVLATRETDGVRLRITKDEEEQSTTVPFQIQTREVAMVQGEGAAFGVPKRMTTSSMTGARAVPPWMLGASKTSGLPEVGL